MASIGSAVNGIFAICVTKKQMTSVLKTDQDLSSTLGLHVDGVAGPETWERGN